MPVRLLQGVCFVSERESRSVGLGSWCAVCSCVGEAGQWLAEGLLGIDIQGLYKFCQFILVSFPASDWAGIDWLPNLAGAGCVNCP